MPRQEAREKAREWFNRFPKAAYMTEIEWWRELDDGRIEFTIRRLPSAKLIRAASKPFATVSPQAANTVRLVSPIGSLWPSRLGKTSGGAADCDDAPHEIVWSKPRMSRLPGLRPTKIPEDTGRNDASCDGAS